jgi:hypothetical protein
MDRVIEEAALGRALHEHPFKAELPRGAGEFCSAGFRAQHGQHGETGEPVARAL